jgi:NAD(P)-dependent dehydrogenase (short-subunit alcohol dehydrogenase family)
MTRTILITGCSSGIGWHCALGLKARGWRVLATARKPEDLARLEAEGLEAFSLDYAHRKSVSACAAEVARRRRLCRLCLRWPPAGTAVQQRGPPWVFPRPK